MIAPRLGPCAVLALLGWGCATAPPRATAPPPVSLPPLGPERLAQVAPPPVRRADPLATLPPGPPVTLAAVDVDVRTLLATLAEAAGISLVLSPEVRGRISVNLVEVPALTALQQVLAQAELAVAAGPLQPAWSPVVFYALPVNLDRADVELIRTRFGVSRELAEWIVANRHR